MVNDIKTKQRLLNLGGFGHLAVDGIEGPLTRAALTRWHDAADTHRRNTATFDPRTEKNLATLLPSFQHAIRHWLIHRALPAAADLGLTLKIICGTRDWAEQNALYAKGRTTTGPKVTNARAGSSFHNYGVAFDIGLFTATGAYITSDAQYIRLFEKAGVPDGCVWGGHFKSFKDYPHVESHAVGSTISTLKRRCK